MQSLDQTMVYGPWALVVAALVLAAGFGWLAAFRATWSRPPIGRMPSTKIAADPPPTHLPAAVAARLAARGTRVQQITATIVELAARGVVHIEERQAPARLFGRSFEVHLVSEPAAPEPHEAALLDVLFGRAGHRVRSVTWRRVQQQANGKSLAFARALLETMRRAGFVDEERLAARRTVTKVAVTIAFLACWTGVLAAVLLPLFGAWGFAVPAAVVAVVIAFAIAAGSLSILSRRGEEEARQWREFFGALAQPAGAEDAPRPIPPDWLPWAIAAGAGHLAAKHLAGPVPPWFRTAGTREDGAAAFAALLHTTGAEDAAAAGDPPAFAVR